MKYLVKPSGASATAHGDKAGAAQAAKAAMARGNRSVSITDGQGRPCELYETPKSGPSVRLVKA